MNKFLLVFLVLLFPLTAAATHVAVLETVAAKESQVSAQECRYMTDELRNAALRVLPAEQNYTIMTRENISVMLPPGVTVEDCEGECLAETGRKIAADYVVQAHIAVFGTQLTLTAELYATASGKLVGSFTGRGDDVNALLQVVESQSEAFFRKIKQNVSGFGGGFGFIQDYSSFAVEKKKSFIINVVTEPAGAALSIDGRPISKCTSTPCKIQVEEGEHRFLAVRDRYDDAGSAVVISENDQTVLLKMSPAFGFLKLDPVYPDSAGNDDNLKIFVGDSLVSRNEMELNPGIYPVQIYHSCYNPLEFEVAVAKAQHYNFAEKLVRGISGLSLTVEQDGAPAIVSVYVDGVEIGQTPYVGPVPMCSKISVGDSTQQEVLDIPLLWHETVEYKHTMKPKPKPAKPVVPYPIPKPSTDTAKVVAQDTVPARTEDKDDVEEELEQVKQYFVEKQAKAEEPVPEPEPESELKTVSARENMWHLGMYAALTYNDFWGTTLGLDKIAGKYDGYTIRTSHAEDLMQKFWAMGINAGVSFLLMFHPYWGTHVELGASFRRGRAKTDMGISLMWDDPSLPDEYDDIVIDFYEKQWNIDVPLLLRFNVPEFAYVEAGPVASFCVKSRSESTVESAWGNSSYREANFTSATEVDMMFSLGTLRQVGSNTLDLSIRLMLGLTALNLDDNAPKTFQIQFHVGYWFL